MVMEGLVKGLLEGHPGVDWSPGVCPPTLSDLGARPAAAYLTAARQAAGSPDNPAAIVELIVLVRLWASGAQELARWEESIQALLAGAGFLAQAPAQASFTLDPAGERRVYVSAMAFKGWVDQTTHWVYKHNG